MNPLQAEIQHKVWGIRPEAMRLISAYVRGEVTAEAVLRSGEVGPGPEPEAAATRFSNTGAVAIINLQGVITPRGSFSLFGGYSEGLASFRRNLREAVASEDIGAIVLNVDSPGGRIDLVPETASEVRAARDEKPVIAVANTMAGSAAYWIASQATELVVTPSGDVGSVGVFIYHEEYSEMDKRLGISTTLIKAGRYKAEGNPYEPLSDEAKEHFQEVVDGTYDEFLEDVAKGRGISASKVRSNFGEGRMVKAHQAVTAGMADRVNTVEEVLIGLTRGRRNGARADDDSGNQPVAETPELEQEQVANGESQRLAQIAQSLNETTRSLKEDSNE